MKKKDRIQHSRRDFLKNSSLAAAGFFIVPRHVLGRGFIAPSDKLTIAAIGAGSSRPLASEIPVRDKGADYEQSARKG